MKYLKNLPTLKDGLAYNYILLTSSGNIKIGRTTNIYQRVKQLSNSNCGGYKIINYCISPPNYISRMMERIFHEKYNKYRIEGEYFAGLDFDEVCHFFQGTFESESFKRANENKKKLYVKETDNVS